MSLPENRVPDSQPVKIHEVALSVFDGEPRARDLDIADRLGFQRPRKIRELIERNRVELEGFGALAPQRGAPITSGKGRVMEVEEYWLNEEQALLVAVLSNAPRAAEVRAMLIKVFVAWRRGRAAPAAVSVAEIGNEGRKVIGGIMKTVVHAEISTILPAMVRAELTSGMMLRHGRTAGQIWREHGFPQLKNAAQWFGNRLERMGCRVDGRGELGLTKARLFDPDKAESWLRNGGAHLVKQKVAERQGQGRLRLVGEMA